MGGVRIRGVVLVGLLLIASAWSAVPGRIMAQSDAVKGLDCPVEFDDRYEVTCSLVTVPEEHQANNGKTIQIAVAVVKSTADSPSEPLVMAQGGPGGSTLDFGQSFLGSFPVMDNILEQRDIVLIEQRGTLHSVPALYCEELDELTIKYIEQTPAEDTVTEIAKEQVETARACLMRHEKAGINLSAFDSVENAADIPEVMTALGYENFAFYGVSYGTMLGQHLLRDHSDRVVSAILDANVPLSVNYIPNVPTYADRAFREMLMACAADQTCKRAYPNLESRFFALVAKLNEEAASFPVTDPVTEKTYDAKMNGDGLVDFLFQLLYAAPTAIPLIIDQVEKGDMSIVTAIYPQLVFDRTFATGMHYTVMCAEDADYTLEDANIIGLYPEIKEVFGTPEAVGNYLEVCKDLGIEVLGSWVDEPVTSEVPTLVLSGRFDPITPPVGGEIVAKTLPNAAHYVFANGGHGAISELTCAPTLLPSFLADPANPDDACVAKLVPSFPVAQGAEPDATAEPEVTLSEDGAAYENDTFSVALPAAWTNQSEGDTVTIVNPENAATLHVVVISGMSEDEAERSARETFDVQDAEFSDEYTSTTLAEEWKVRNYATSGDDVVITLTRPVGEQVIVCIFKGTPETFRDSLPTLRGVFNSIRVK